MTTLSVITGLTSTERLDELKRLLLSLRLTNADLALTLGVRLPTVRYWLDGTNGVPSPVLVALAALERLTPEQREGLIERKPREVKNPEVFKRALSAYRRAAA